jgi:hypothetical protein
MSLLLARKWLYVTQSPVSLAGTIKVNASMVSTQRGETRHQWFKPAILATWKAEKWRIVVGGQPGQIVHEILFSK